MQISEADGDVSGVSSMVLRVLEHPLTWEAMPETPGSPALDMPKLIFTHIFTSSFLVLISFKIAS